MYQAIIIDDEKWAIKSLLATIRGQEYFYIVKEPDSGASALEYIRKYQPELAIIDGGHLNPEPGRIQFDLPNYASSFPPGNRLSGLLLFRNGLSKKQRLHAFGIQKRKERNVMKQPVEKPWEQGPLTLTENRRYFSVGGKPFFLLGDTAWLLFHRLSLEESGQYLRNRKELGYTCILADFIHSPDQKNLNGDSALIDSDPARPDLNGGFWTHVDAVIRLAQDLGLYMGILPTWGSVVKSGALREDNADAWLDFILQRYHDTPNLFWVLGGDVRGDVAPGLYRHMGRRMKEDRPDRLITYHPFGRTSSSLWFQEEDWLDFNLFQSGHRRYDQVTLNEWDDNTAKEEWFGEDNWRYVAKDSVKEPVRPVLDGEPSYEQIPQGLHDGTQPRWQAADVRRYAYWSVFEGAAGHVYGHNSIMQFYRDKHEKGAYSAAALWSEAIHHPGGAQMGHLKRLMERVDFTSGRPATEYLAAAQGEKYDRISVFAGDDFLFAYTYTGLAISLSLTAWEGRKLAAYWMSPVTGCLSYIRTVTGGGTVTFTPPKREESQDIVLALFS